VNHINQAAYLGTFRNLPDLGIQARVSQLEYLTTPIAGWQIWFQSELPQAMAKSQTITKTVLSTQTHTLAAF